MTKTGRGGGADSAFLDLPLLLPDMERSPTHAAPPQVLSDLTLLPPLKVQGRVGRENAMKRSCFFFFLESVITTTRLDYDVSTSV